MRKKTGGKCQSLVLANVDGVVVLGAKESTTPTSLDALWLNSEVWLMTGSHRQPPMKDFVHLPIHLGGIKPSTQRDRLSVALMSNVQCLVTARLVENHQTVA